MPEWRNELYLGVLRGVRMVGAGDKTHTQETSGKKGNGFFAQATMIDVSPESRLLNTRRSCASVNVNRIS